MINLIKIQDGCVYVVDLEFDRDRPIVNRRWYPTNIMTYFLKREGIKDGSPLIYDLHEGYIFKFSNDPYSRGIIIPLKNGRNTTPEHVDEVEVAKPNTKRKGELVWALLPGSSSYQWCLETRTKTGYIKVVDLPQPSLEKYVFAT